MRVALVRSKSDPQELRRLTDSTTVLLLLPRQDVMSSIIFLSSVGHCQRARAYGSTHLLLTYICQSSDMECKCGLDSMFKTFEVNLSKIQITNLKRKVI